METETKPLKTQKTVKEKILDIFFPPHIKCIICENDIDKDNIYEICEECLINLPFNNDKICARCGTKLTGEADYCLICKNNKKVFEKAVSPFLFEDELKNLVHNFKYNKAYHLFKPLAHIMAEWFKRYDFYADYIIPVPLHENKLKERGYNQAEELAKHIAWELEIPMLADVVIRKKETETQTYLSAKERKQNLKDAFKVQSVKQIKDKTLLIIDDVFTTGGTVREFSKTLMEKGAGKIFVLTLCHTDLNKKTEEK